VTILTLIREIERKGESGDSATIGASCDLRCMCGSLVAKVIGSHVELKCRRCKRTLRIPVQRDP
jgi:hypothetical protein